MKIKGKELTQWCIKSHFFDEIMKIPANVHIEELAFELGFFVKRHSLPVPKELAECGVTYMRESKPSFELQGTMVFKTRKEYRDAMDTICDAVKLPRNCVRVRRMKVSYNGSVGTFSRCTKKFKGEDEKVKNIKVMGMFEWDGDDRAIAHAISADKFACKYDVQTIRTVLCEEKK